MKTRLPYQFYLCISMGLLCAAALIGCPPQNDGAPKTPAGAR